MAGTDGDRRLRPRLRKCRLRTSLRARPVVCHQHEDRLLIEGDGHRVVAKALRGLGDGDGHAHHRLEVATTEVQYRLGEQGSMRAQTATAGGDPARGSAVVEARFALAQSCAIKMKIRL